MTDELTIGQAADLVGVSRKAIRHYEKIGLIRPHRAGNGYRTYGPEDILRLARIRQLQGLGLSLQRIRQLLSGHGSEDLWNAVLESLLGEIDGQIAALEARRERIEEIVAGDAPDPLDAQGIQLPDAPRVQEYLEQHLSPRMWLQEKSMFAAIERVRRVDNQASILAAADLIVALAENAALGRGVAISPDVLADRSLEVGGLIIGPR